jgi:hypothetical protein
VSTIRECPSHAAGAQHLVEELRDVSSHLGRVLGVLELDVASGQNLVSVAVHELLQLHVCFPEMTMPTTSLNMPACSTAVCPLNRGRCLSVEARCSGPRR